ncbi:MAG: Flagellar FliJ protein [Acidobacteria bacterium]|nr:Flagellar FliJ protein [Acidobacteriota bacterium]
MGKFKYNLETLLQYREEIENRERDALHQLTCRHQLEENIRNGLAAKLHETMHDLVAMCGDRSRDQELTWFHLYLTRLTREISESDKRLAQLKSEIRAQKEAVMNAMKNRKTLASMKAKKEKEFFVELGRQEQKEMDDLVLARYAKTEPGEAGPAEIRRTEGAAKHQGRA